MPSASAQESLLQHQVCIEFQTNGRAHGFICKIWVQHLLLRGKWGLSVNDQIWLLHDNGDISNNAIVTSKAQLSMTTLF